MAAATASRAPPSPASVSYDTAPALRCSTALANVSSSTSSERLFVGIVEGGGVELGELEARQVELTGPRPLVAPKCRQLGVELGDPRPRRPQPGEIDTAEGVERRPLARRRQQALVGVLAVEVDELVAASASAAAVAGRPSM